MTAMFVLPLKQSLPCVLSCYKILYATSKGCASKVSRVMRSASPVRNEQLDSEREGLLVHEKGVQHTMQTAVLPVGSLVDVTCYCPFRGLKGTIQTVSTIADDAEKPFCYYLVYLEGTSIQEPIWFEHNEVEAAEEVAPPLSSLS